MIKANLSIFCFALHVSLLILINFLWQGLEFLFYGYVTPNWPDTVIFILFATSLHYNMKYIYQKVVKMYE